MSIEIEYLICSVIIGGGNIRVFNKNISNIKNNTI